MMTLSISQIFSNTEQKRGTAVTRCIFHIPLIPPQVTKCKHFPQKPHKSLKYWVARLLAKRKPWKNEKLYNPEEPVLSEVEWGDTKNPTGSEQQ